MSERFTIQISSSLVDRLAEQDGKVKKPKKSKSKSQGKEHVHRPPIDSKTSTPAGGWPPLPSQLPLPLVQPPAAPPSAAVTNPEIHAIQSILKESEQVIERMKKIEANMTEEVKQRAKELHDKEFKLPYQKPLPCVAEKDACLQCYKEHMKDPLKCARVARNFADCARQARQQA
ncbi:uncharacterized protein LOC116249673 [Nymphaea colorata]|nr:uncharacterized protein LOC116249673 [Nymphaea colorata]XP_031478725.1 uncharacterized protein LOC116249673 [Nymphaea colorata]